MGLALPSVLENCCSSLLRIILTLCWHCGSSPKTSPRIEQTVEHSCGKLPSGHPSTCKTIKNKLLKYQLNIKSPKQCNAVERKMLEGSGGAVNTYQAGPAFV